MIPLSDPDLRHRGKPFVTWTLIVINIFVFTYQAFIDDVSQFLFSFRFGAIPSELLGRVEMGSEMVQFGQEVLILNLSSPFPIWTTIFTSMFLHGGFIHLGGNMLYLWVFGDNIEHRFGHFRYLIFYFVSGFVAVWAHVLIHPSSTVPIIGASGAIAGVLGAYFLLFPHSRITTLFVIGFIFLARVPALILLGFYALLQVFSGVWSLIPENPAIGGVAYFAHLGGLIVGLATAGVFKIIRKESFVDRSYKPRNLY